MDAADYQKTFYPRLPRGECWPEQEGEMPDWDALISAFAQYAALIDASAETLLGELIPSTSTPTAAGLLNDWLELAGLPAPCETKAWASYTDDQKRAALLAKLQARGAVDRASIQDVLRTLRADPNVVLRNRAQKLFVIGSTPIGSAAIGSAYQAAWRALYMPNVLAGLPVAPDEFEAWANISSITENSFGSPVTLGQTADRVTPSVTGGGLSAIWLELPGLPDDQTIQLSVWARTPEDAGTKGCQLLFINKVADSFSVSVQLTECWHRLELRAPIGSGGGNAFFFVAGPTSETPEFLLSWATAGIVDPGLECRANELGPLNTTPVYDVIALPGLELSDDISGGTIIDDITLEEVIDA